MPKAEVPIIDKMDSILQCWKLFTGGRNLVNVFYEKSEIKVKAQAVAMCRPRENEGSSAAELSCSLQPSLG